MDMKYNYEEVIHIIENTRRFGSQTGYEVSMERVLPRHFYVKF